MEELETLKKELEKAVAERDEYLNGWQRAKADFANAKKRADEDLKMFRLMANAGLIEELLPVLQSFEMAFANKESWEKADANWRMGIEHIYNQLRIILESNGLKEVAAEGSKVDHAVHEAVSVETVDDESKDGTVLRVLEKGYTLNGRLIKPAKVIVGEKKVV